MNKATVTVNGQGQRYGYAPNETITFLLSTAETSGKLDFTENELGYLGGPPLHIHPNQDETHYLLQGQLRYQIGEETLDLNPGDCLYIPRGTPHAWVNLQQEPARILAVLTPGGSEGFFKTLASPPDPLEAEALMQLGQAYGADIVGPPLAVMFGLEPG